MNVRTISNTIFSAGTIGNVTTSKNLIGSWLLAGYDIGTDYAMSTSGDATFGAGKGNIGAITVGGTMSSSSIAAGIAPGAGLHFGDDDDSVLVSSSLEGAIKSLTVTGLSGPTNVVVSHKALGALKVGTTAYKTPWPAIANLVIKDNIV